jgi:predicted permease
MNDGSKQELPPEIEQIIREVLRSANLHLVDGVDEVARELRAHFEDGLAAGTPTDELIAKFGDPVVAGARIARTRPKAAARNRGEHGRWWMSPREWWDEVRKAARRLGRAPGFALIVVITLALGVGANTAIFTVLDAVLLEDLPYPEPERLVRVYESSNRDPTMLQFMRAPMVAEYRTWDEVFEGLGSLYTYREVGADLTDGDRPERVTVVRVSAGYFETLGIPPARGRTFTEGESFGPGENVSSTLPIERVAVISHQLWTTRYEADPDLLGSSLQLDGFDFEVVGVMPRGFNNPFGTKADVWVPLDLRPGGSNGFGNFYLSAVARLKPGITVEAAQERLKVLSLGFEDVSPGARGAFPRIVPLQADVVGATRKAMLWILATAAGLVLLTACVNVANLLFARGLGRDRDLALRAALGSGRGRLIASILTENSLLAVAGGLVGLALGWAGVRALLFLAPDALPMAAEIEMGGTVFAFAFAVTTAALLVFGLAPALRMSRTAPADVLRSGDRASTVGRTVKRLRDMMVVVQVAAALVLVAGSLLLTRSFDSLLSVPLGVEPEGVLTFEVHLPGARYVDGEARHRFHEELQDRVAGLPGVDAVGATSWLPVNGAYHTWGFQWDPENPGPVNDGAFQSTDVRIVAGDYFGVMGIELLQGVGPEQVDLEAEPMVWVNQQLADEVFAGVEPVGLQIGLAGGEGRRIMGIVETIPEDARGGMSRKSYIPHAQYSDNRNWSLIQTVKARGDLTELREQIRGEIRAIDPQLVLYRPQSFEGVLGTVRAQDRFATVLMGAFAVLALVLSLVGTYGVLSGSVQGRTREIGIRMALGADNGSLRRMVLRHAAALTLPGVALGLLGAWLASRWIEALLFGVEAVDPVAYGLAVLVFLGVGLFSGWLPAVRATRVDTVQTLASE